MPVPSEQAPLRSEFADDPEMQELVEMFVDELPDRIGAISTAWDDRQLEDLKRLAHQLKGASGGYGFPIIGEAAAKLEAELKALGGGEDTQTVGPLASDVDALVALCSRAIAGTG